MKSIPAFLAGAAAAGVALGATPALAYIGPGAGLSLLGALWGVLAAVLASLLFLLIWPLRRLLRRRHGNVARTAQQTSRQGETPQGSATAPRR